MALPQKTVFASHTCACCGQSYDLDYINPECNYYSTIIKDNICFTCAYWRDLIQHPKENHQIINGVYYVFQGWSETKDLYMGYRGQPFYALTNDKKTIRSNNVACQGVIPEWFKESLPDTARFISKKFYYQINQLQSFQCHKKGCWDRYDCLWFDITLEERNGPWNIVPARHKVGCEQCPNFVNKSNTNSNK